ncbi:hypothetical protein B0I37DRAFT_113768 [Chaetomium sp. MPI-CAGE-AT-0009]|nr:hypothetical protein B0I37DRAFT_113768 [Chaetomium sp. MPI-CAGE-AT-0009]
MKYTTAVFALAATAALAQDISVFPECSLPCIIDAVGTTSCEATDFACVCGNMEAVKQAATPCVVDKCGLDKALNEVLPATEKFCADVGNGGGDDGGETPPPPPTTTLATVTTTTPTSTTAPEQPEPTETETPGEGDGDDDDDDEPTETASSGGSMVTPGPTGSAIPPTPTGGDDDDDDTPPPATSSIQTAGAAVVGAVGSFGMLLLGAVAAL